jgi:hypothetical protein
MNILPRVGISSGSALYKIQIPWRRIVALFESPWVAYGLLLILQLKAIWGIWAYREVTLGDTTSYYTMAWQWFKVGKVNITYSPAYTAFYGSFLFINLDPIWATFAHRVVIVVASSLLVLAVLRRLLPPSVAWFCAAWWAVLPIVFNTMYEVHLFATIPVLCVWLLLLTAQTPWRRAAALGLLATSIVLVRNELSVPCGLLALVLTGYEWREIRRGKHRTKQVLLAYSIAGLSAIALCWGAYERSIIQYPQLRTVAQYKHTLNMAQVYAFGYQQRHPEWDLNPWLQCYSLMNEHFGKPAPTLREMMAANPRAVLEHFAWNLSLTPSGVQLLLFNRGSGTINPDYDGDVPRRLKSTVAMGLSVCLLAVWLMGCIALWSNRQAWWRDWLSARALGWVGMFAVAAVVPLIILSQRPRPSYLFTFGFVLIAITGMCFHAATTRWRLADRIRMIAPLAMIALLMLVPRQFSQAHHRTQQPQYVANAVNRLIKHRGEIMIPKINLLVPADSVGFYANPTLIHMHPLNQFPGKRTATIGLLYEFPWFLEDMKSGESFPAICERLALDFVYLDELSLANLQAMPNRANAGTLIDGLEAPGWHLIDGGCQPGDRWRLYRREK